MRPAVAPADTPSPATRRLPPLESWQAIKEVMRERFGMREWNMWIRHARLCRILADSATMLISLPRDGRATFGSMRRKNAVNELARKLGYSVVFTVQATPEDIERCPQAGEYLESPTSELWGARC